MTGFCSLADEQGTAPIAELQAGERWYVVQSQPRKELYAASNLTKQGFRPFVPRMRKTIRHARRTTTELRAMFPRYLFVALNPMRDRWRSVLGTFGVTTMIMEGDGPKPVPQGVVEALYRASDRTGALQFTSQLAVGQDVRFLTGPFADMVGRLVRLDDSGRIDVLMQILGAERTVSATTTALMPIEG